MKLIDKIKQGTEAEQTITIRGYEVDIHPLSDKAFSRAVRRANVKMSFAQLKAASKDLLGTADLLDFSIAICAEGMVGYSPEVEDYLRGGISAEIAAKIIEITFGEGENVEDFSKAPTGSN